MLGKLMYPTIKEMINRRQYFLIKDALAEMPPSDVAELLEDIEEAEDRVLVYRLLPRQLATDTFEHITPPVQEELLRGMSKEKLRHLLEDMSPDDRTQLFEELPAHATRRLLNILSPEERRLAQMLLAYPEDSVGRLMTPNFVYLYEDLTVEKALEKIRRAGISSETIYNCYVVDSTKTLKGVTSLKDLVLSEPDKHVVDIMNRNIVSINTRDDQEDAALLCDKYDLLALPVVDREGKIVGIVTVDDLIEVIVEEATEDIQLIGAVLPSEEDFMNTRVHQWVWRRVVWLFALLITGLLTALVIRKYDSLLTKVIALTFFIPVLTSTGGNTGSQASVLLIRALALGQVRYVDVLKIMQKQILVGLLLGMILGSIMFMIVRIVSPGEGLSFSLAVALGLGTVVFTANLVGSIMPLILKAVGLDPALTSGPFISTIMDVLGLLIYLQIAIFLLHLSF